jgi:hypothetical protein
MAKAKNAHGGKRSGAGRKPSLSFWERMRIGGLCEEKWRATSEAAALSAFQAQPHIIDVQEEQNRLMKIPVKLRGSQKPLPDGLTVAETIEEVSQEIDAILSSAGASRYVSIPIRRPQGAKEGVLEEVFVLVSGIPSQKISKRMVKKCWDEFRSVEARIRSELS